jgi:hypothetical protein
MAPVARNEGVVRQRSDILEALHARGRRIAHVGDPDLAGVVEAEDEPPARRVHQAHDLGSLWGGGGFSLDIGDQLQRPAIENLHPARLVVGDRDQPAVLGNRAADRVAGLHDTFDDGRGKEIDFAEAPVATEDEGVAAVARKDRRGMAEIAQPVDPGDGLLLGGVDDLYGARGTLHDDPEVAGPPQLLRSGARGERREGGDQEDRE